MELHKSSLSKNKGRPPRKAPPRRPATEEEKEALFLLVLLRLVVQVERWKRGVPKGRSENSAIRKAEQRAQKALCDFVRLALSEGRKKRS